MSNLYRGSSNDVSYKVLIHLARRFQRRFFRNQPIRNKNCLWQPYLLTNRDEMSGIYRGPSIDASYQVSFHLVKCFQRLTIFRNPPIRYKHCLWRPCLLTNRDEMIILYRGSSINVFYKISVHLGKRFKRRRFF